MSRAAVTSWFEVLGLLLLAVAAVVAVSRWSVAGGVATGGGVLLLESALLTWRGPLRRSEGVEAE